MSGDLADLYRDLILDHSRRRRGEGPLEAAHAEHHELNPTCGDEVTVRIRLDPTRTTVESMRWEGSGCSISMASASVLAERAEGMSIAGLAQLVDGFRSMMRSRGAGEPDEDLLGDGIAFHGVSKYVMRVKCAMLAWVALEACVRQAER